MLTYADCGGPRQNSSGNKGAFITLADSKIEEKCCLTFSGDSFEDLRLKHIYWIIIDEDQSSFSSNVVSAIRRFGFLPVHYHYAGYNDEDNAFSSDVLVFRVDDGYYIQLFVPGQAAKYSYTYVTPGIDKQPSLDSVFFLGEAATLAEDYQAVHIEDVLQMLKNTYGDINSDGLQQGYYYEGIALYDEVLYYSIRWSQLVLDEDGGGHSSYNGQIYVSFDASTVYLGFYDEIVEKMTP